MPEMMLDLLENAQVRCQNVGSGALLYTERATEDRSIYAHNGFYPGSLCAAALGACTMTIIGCVGQQKGIDVSGTRARVTDAADEKHTRITKVTVEFFMPPRAYTVREKKLLENAIKTCSVHRSLHPDMEQTFIFHWQEAPV